MSSLTHNFLRKSKKTILSPIKLLIKLIDSSNKKKKILRNKRTKNKCIIKVGFVVQMPEIWDKESSLYEKMVKDNRFDVYLIIVPSFDISKSQLKQYGEEKQYFIKNYPDAKVILLSSAYDYVIDDSFDYIFYQRCWEYCLPEQLHLKHVINYSITCYIPYCFHCGPLPESYYKTDFFYYLNKFYTCSLDQNVEVSKISGVESQFLGYPVFDSLINKYKTTNKTVGYNILWTPRWTDDINTGGSTFLEYKDSIIELKSKFENINIILRPHPLTFENAIKSRWMTESEVTQYKKRVVDSGVFFDDNSIIEDTFLHTDLLITDFTSAIVPFFLTGKPIIYCARFDFEITETFRKILDVSYKANNWEDVISIISDIINGRDSLFAKRQELICNFTQNNNSVDLIIEDLVSTIT